MRNNIFYFRFVSLEYGWFPLLSIEGSQNKLTYLKLRTILLCIERARWRWKFNFTSPFIGGHMVARTMRWHRSLHQLKSDCTHRFVIIILVVLSSAISFIKRCTRHISLNVREYVRIKRHNLSMYHTSNTVPALIPLRLFCLKSIFVVSQLTYIFRVL